MALKLFRSTGYSSILAPGESRVPMHPFWVVAAASAWIGFACNVALWRALGPGDLPGPGLSWALTAGLFASGCCGLVLSLLAWRRTLKPAATLLLLLAATAATGVWLQSAPIDANVLAQGLGGLMPGWAGLLSWQGPVLLVVLGVLPVLWLWQAQMRRLPGPRQLGANVGGMACSAMLAGVSGWMLLRGLA